MKYVASRLIGSLPSTIYSYKRASSKAAAVEKLAMHPAKLHEQHCSMFQPLCSIATEGALQGIKVPSTETARPAPC